MDAFLEALERKRGKMSVAVFADELGIHYSTYYRLLRGERGLGADVQRRIIRRYPELALVFLSGISPFGDEVDPTGEDLPTKVV